MDEYTSRNLDPKISIQPNTEEEESNDNGSGDNGNDDFTLKPQETQLEHELEREPLSRPACLDVWY